MDTRRALLVDAFTREPLAGNAAGVVPDADGLSEAQCRAVAAEFGASETGFVHSSGVADRRLRFFTPSTTVDLCGHATVAAHAHLHSDGVIEAGEHTVETDAGVLDVEAEADGRVWMTQASPDVHTATVTAEEVAEALGVDESALDVDGLPLATASTGVPYLVVPVRLLSDLGGATPEGEAIEALAEEAGAAGVYAFTFDTLDADSTVHARMWAPGLGIPEDPVTGTGAGSVGAYLRRFEAFDAMPDPVRVEQGHFVDRPGTAFVDVGASVRVGGYAATALDGTLSVPELDEGDGIIEA